MINWIDTSYTKLLSILFVMWSISFQNLLSVKFHNPFFVWHFLPFMVTCLLIHIWLWNIESSVYVFDKVYDCKTNTFFKMTILHIVKRGFKTVLNQIDAWNDIFSQADYDINIWWYWLLNVYLYYRHYSYFCVSRHWRRLWLSMLLSWNRSHVITSYNLSITMCLVYFWMFYIKEKMYQLYFH